MLADNITDCDKCASVIHLTQTTTDQCIQEVFIEVILETVTKTTTTDTITITVTVVKTTTVVGKLL